MKRILPVLLLITALQLHATDFYFSATGNDRNTGLSAAQAWKTIAKHNSTPHNVGDRFFFRRGDTFYGGIIVKTSGITYGAYGTGAKPVISGLSTVTGWVNISGNIWEAPVRNVKPKVKLVLRDGIIQQIGRYPNLNAANGGFLTFTSSSSTTITGPALSSTTNWTGAEIGIRHNRWDMITHTVSKHSGGVVTFDNVNNDVPRVKYGYFFQRDSRTLDQDGEWYYNNVTAKLRVCSSINPSTYTYRISTIDTLLYNAYDNFSVSGLAFEGSGKYAIRSFGNNGASITNCDVNNSGDEAITTWFASNVIVDNCIVSNSLGSGIYVYNDEAKNGLTVTNCTVRNTSLFLGLESGYMFNGGEGIIVRGSANFGIGSISVKYNKVYSSGYGGISWYGNNASIKYNLVDSFGLRRDDVAGIYTSGANVYIAGSSYNRVVTSNFVLNGIGNNNGTDDANGRAVNGLYVDDGSQVIILDSNTVANIPGGGTHGNDNDSIWFRHNTLFNTYKGFTFQRLRPVRLVRNLTVTKNIIYPYRFEYRNVALDNPTLIKFDQDVRLLGKIDSNYYCRRTGVDASFFGVSTYVGFRNYIEHNGPFSYLINLGHETHSRLVASGGTLETNPGAKPKVVRFTGFSKITPQGTVYNNSATVPAWGSLVLIPNGKTKP